MIVPDPKKIIFLDIDGVLNNDSGSFSVTEWSKRNPGKRFNPFHYFNEENVVEFNRVIRETNASVVISSTWRLQSPKDEFEGESMRPSVLEKIMALNGRVDIMGRIIGFTPDRATYGFYICQGVPRSQEISAYMNESNIDFSAVKFVVVDDMSDAWKGELFVKTDSSIGLTTADADRMIKILNS